MNKRESDSIKDVLNEREYKAVTKLLEEINDKSMSEKSIGSYVKEIKQTLETISHRKNMLTQALDVLEKYIKSGKRDDSVDLEENIKGTRLLNP